MSRPKVTIYTDGGCQPNPGPGGWAAILLPQPGDPVELSGRAEDSTNNRMEITAALEALQSLETPSDVELITDSTYLKNGITQWISGWRRRGWRTASKQPVKNQDLWQALDRATQRHQIRWRWTKGHAGDRWNERADELATQARGDAAETPKPVLPLADEGAVHAFLGASWSGKHRRGGWGVVLTFDGMQRELSGRVEDGTANSAHLFSADQALAALKRPIPVHLYTVSDYLQRGATSWLEGWKRNRWQTASGNPVASRELWLQLDQRIRRLEGQGRTLEWHLVDRTEAPTELERARELARTAQNG